MEQQTAAAALPQRECDLIMEGGITSGIVYPRLIAELSTTYRLRRIGGTSAGAIAAAAAAAAEYGRQHGVAGSLAAVGAPAGELKHPTQKARGRCVTRLFTLFQPAGRYAEAIHAFTALAIS